jgi:hypothetical protein
MGTNAYPNANMPKVMTVSLPVIFKFSVLIPMAYLTAPKKIMRTIKPTKKTMATEARISPKRKLFFF